MPEYTAFQDGRSNSLSHVKSELLVSYSKFPLEKIDFLTKPIVLAVIHNPSFPHIYIAVSAAYTSKIAAHLHRRRQRQPSPCRIVDHLDDREVAQHTPLVA